MRFKYLAIALFATFPALAQIPYPSTLNLSDRITCGGFPCLNSGTLVMPSDANYTMTAGDSSAVSMKVTSSVSLTATRNVVFPAGRFLVNVENATTGGQIINVCGPSGGCYSVPNDGNLYPVWNDGTGFVGPPASGGGTGCIPGGSTNVLQKNGGSGTCTPSSITDTGTTVVGTEPATFPAVNTVINAGSSLSTAVTACGSANTTIQITQTIAVGTGITVPANCTLLFQSAGNLTGTSIAFAPSSKIQAGLRQIFGTGLAVTGLGGDVPLEWFGGKLDGTLTPSTGTDNCTPFSASLASLSSGGNVILQAGNGTLIGYRTTCEVDVTSTGTGIVGVALDQNYGSPYTGSHGATLILDSATINGIIVSGNAQNNTVRNISVVRTVRPTGTTSMGIGVVGTTSRLVPGAVIEHNSSSDSVNDFYFKGAAFGSGGRVAYNGAYWGSSGLSSPAGGGCGFFIDSGDGTSSSSTLFSVPNSAQTNVGGSGLTGLCIKGIVVSDNVIDGFQTAGLDYGIDLENTGTSGFVAQDVLIRNSVMTACGIACIKINGAQSATDLAPHVFITGGNIFPTGTSSVGVWIENSTNVAVSGVQIFGGGSGITGILLSSVDGFVATGNTLEAGTSPAISCLNSTHGTVSNNQIKEEFVSGVGIQNVGCTLVSEQGNSIAGSGGSNLGTGMSFDSGSSNNGPWSLNNIDSATVTTPVSDAGTGNNTMRPTSLVAGNVTDSALTSGNCVEASTGGLLTDTGSPCGSGGSGPTIQTNTVNNASQVLLNFTTSTANSVGLTATPVNTSGGIEKIEITGSSYTGNAATATLSTTATNLAGGALGSAPYQNAAGTTLFIASPTTTGHTFLYGWQPLGSAIVPVAIDGATYLASPPAIGGTSPAAIGGTIITANMELVAAALGTATNVSNFGSAGYISLASYWTGSAAAVDNWNWSTQLGTGSNPTSTLNFGHTGTSGISTVLMPNLTIGAIAGSAGVLTFGNATSGSIALTPPTGALGTVTLTVPDANDTLVGRGTTDTLSNKTLVAPALGTPASGIMTNVTGNATGLNSGTATNLLICSDTSASGTAQTCTTSPSFTPAANSCAIYTTTTANSGTGLTLNVNSLGAKSVAKWLGTTTLAAGDVAANSPQLACYNGTVWNLSTIGNAPSGGTVTWNGISNPTGNQSLSMGNVTTTWTFGTATGSTTPMVTFTDSASNTGTGPVLKVATAASSAGFPAQFFQRGTALLTVGATGGGTGSGFAGPLWVNATSNVQGAGLYVGASGIYGIGGSTLINSASGNTQPLTLQNGTTPANGTSVSMAFQAINSAFSNKSVGIITGTIVTDTSTSEEGTLSFSTIHLGSQVTALTLSGAGNGVTTGTITSALGNAAITSATGGTGVTSVTCATAACNVSRGSYTVVGGTATTGTIITLLWPTTTTAWVCSVDMNGGTGFLGIGHSVATATGMNITSAVTVATTTFTIDYNCVP